MTSNQRTPADVSEVIERVLAMDEMSGGDEWVLGELPDGNGPAILTTGGHCVMWDGLRGDTELAVYYRGAAPTLARLLHEAHERERQLVWTLSRSTQQQAIWMALRREDVTPEDTYAYDLYLVVRAIVESVKARKDTP